jgi:hypothetical protein
MVELVLTDLLNHSNKLILLRLVHARLHSYTRLGAATASCCATGPLVSRPCMLRWQMTWHFHGSALVYTMMWSVCKTCHFATLRSENIV